MITIYDSRAQLIRKPAKTDEEIETTDSKFPSHIENFLQNYEKSFTKDKQKSEQSIQVSQAMGSVAFLYEKIRNTIEYKGEQVLRRNAIERILKRLL